MSRHWMVDPDFINDATLGLMPAEDFKRAFQGAFAGEETPFSRFLRGPYERPPAAEWAAIRLSVFERDDFTCTYCGERGGRLECDHIVPVAKGGRHESSNLTTACRACNRAKRDKLISEWSPRK